MSQVFSPRNLFLATPSVNSAGDDDVDAVLASHVVLPFPFTDEVRRALVSLAPSTSSTYIRRSWSPVLNGTFFAPHYLNLSRPDTRNLSSCHIWSADYYILSCHSGLRTMKNTRVVAVRKIYIFTRCHEKRNLCRLRYNCAHPLYTAACG